jgi:hypothetical protein
MKMAKDKIDMNPQNLIPMLILVACFALLPKVQAVSPPPDGDYPGANTAEGQQALLSLTSGTYNTAVGFSSLKSNITGNFNTGLGAATLLANTGNQNTATGAGALLSNTTGFRNTANGAFALFKNLGAADNTATGNAALFANTTGSGNTANGNFALINNTTGTNNTAIGNGTLASNDTANENTATGAGALSSNTTAGENTADGVNALASNSGSNAAGNTAVGWSALLRNTDGGFNTATGDDALVNNITGFSNTANGAQALNNNTTGAGNTAMGGGALFNNTTGTGNMALGIYAGIGVSTANNVICIGSNGANLDNSCFIGNINGVTLGAGSAVQIDANNQLGTIVSSRRFKKDIEPMDKASERILALRPVTFHYKSDAKGIAQFGLVAEEVEKVNPDLVVRDKEGKPYSVRYEQVNAMLLNEFLKEHRKNEEQGATIAGLKKEVASLAATVKEQATQIQRVSAQIEVSKAVGQTALNKP